MKFATDPHLTQYGIHKGERVAEAIQLDQPLICSSILLRSQETALSMFGQYITKDNPLTILPFCNETIKHNTDLDNMPRKSLWKKFKSRKKNVTLRKIISRIMTNQLSDGYRKDALLGYGGDMVNLDMLSGNKIYEQRPDWRKFIGILEGFHPHKDIVIVTHSDFLNENFFQYVRGAPSKGKPLNNSIWMVDKENTGELQVTCKFVGVPKPGKHMLENQGKICQEVREIDKEERNKFKDDDVDDDEEDDEEEYDEEDDEEDDDEEVIPRSRREFRSQPRDTGSPRIIKSIDVNGCSVKLMAGSVVKYGDPGKLGQYAIVNAANEGGQGGGGIDEVITKMGGPLLIQDRINMCLDVSRGEPCIPTGSAKITRNVKKYDRLQVSAVIHAVGPNYTGDGSDGQHDEQLKTAYTTSLELANSNNIPNIGFPLLSSGIFSGNRDKREIITIGVKSIIQYCVDAAELSLKEVSIFGYEVSEQGILQGIDI